MKIKLVLNNEQAISNEQQIQTEGKHNIVPLNNLNDIHQASCDDILVHDCCDYIPQRTQVLQAIASKLRYGGTVHISGIDFLEVAHALVRGEILLRDTHNLVYSGKSACSTLSDIVKELRTMGMDIVSNRLDGYSYHIVAARPKNV